MYPWLFIDLSEVIQIVIFTGCHAEQAIRMGPTKQYCVGPIALNFILKPMDVIIII